jgi:MFS family permease
MLAWLRDLNSRERSTMLACWGGWTLDGFDGQLYSYVVPTVIGLWGISTGTAGTIGTVALLTSSFGGWITGSLSDRFGRVRMLRLVLALHLPLLVCAEFRAAFCAAGVARAGLWRRMGRGRYAALVYAGLYAALPEATAWRVLFAVGILPALLVLWIRRKIPESEAFAGQTSRPAASAAHLFSAFRGPYFWLTVKVSLMVAGAQGGVYAVQFWMPTYLRTVRHLSATGTGGYVAVQMVGALIGFLLGAYLADAIGRKWTFMLSAVFTVAMVLVYMFVPVNDTALLFLGMPLSTAILMKFSPMGPFMTELYPTELRGTGQGFCYNGGRAIGAFFPTIIGYASQVMPLGTAIALFCTLASGLMIVMLLLLPETRGREIASLQSAMGTANS